MFTGIIKKVVKPIKILKSSNSLAFQFPIPNGWKLTEGESINIDGICSTVTKLTKSSFEVFYMDETLKKTSLLKLDKKHQFNLERSLKASDLMGGHFVSGHIDTTGVVKAIKSEIFTIQIPQKFTKYIIYKGSIALNGVSLTVVSVDKTSFAVSLIPHTLAKTNLRELKVSDSVNIEVDLMAKYLEKLNSRHAA